MPERSAFIREPERRPAEAEPAPPEPEANEPLVLGPGAPSVLRVADSGSRTAALHGLQRHAGNAAVSRLVEAGAAAASAEGAVIQRYQAGESGHGGIEAEALGPGGAGFGADEARSIYVGNWLRDLSQLNGGPAMQMLIRILALGEFGHEVDLAELGDYVPSEHLDNPAGGGTVEDPEVQKDPARLQDALGRLSGSQREAYDREEAARADIQAASARSHLPEYIERGKMHAKDKLIGAVRAGRNDRGRMLMGDALHAVEDYFSHSNFVEACVATLQQQGDQTIAPLAGRLNQVHLGANRALLLPTNEQGEIQIQTGTYAGEANKLVSKLELLQTELEHGYMARAAVIGYFRMIGMTGEDLGRRLGGGALGGLGSVLGGAGGGLVGGVAGGIGGAGRGAVGGAQSGFEAGEQLGGGGLLGGALGVLGGIGGGIGSAVRGLFGGAAEGAVEGAHEGSELVGGLGTRAGEAVGGAAGYGLAEIVAAAPLAAVLAIAGGPLAAIIGAAMAAGRAGLIERLSKHETDVSGGEARDLGLAGPTHSELAKDDPEHPLFDVSRALAVEADRELGKAMIDAWNGLVHTTTDRPVSLAEGEEPGASGESPDTSAASQNGSAAAQNGSGRATENGDGSLPTEGPRFNEEVDRRFWSRTNYKVGRRLDPNNPADRPFVRQWLTIRDEVRDERGGGAATIEMEPEVIEVPVERIEMEPEVVEAQPESPQEQAVASLVDKYVCHPDQSDWWVPVVREAAGR